MSIELRYVQVTNWNGFGRAYEVAFAPEKLAGLGFDHGIKG
jgi:hypothetical protein